MKFDQYHKVAGAAYDRVADRGGHFELGDLVEEVLGDLVDIVDVSELLRTVALTLVQTVDDRRTASADAAQLDLLTGEAKALDVVWRLGDGWRIRARYATRADALKWIDLRAQNARRVAEAYSRDRDRIAVLLPFLNGSTTVAVAVDAYRADQGDPAP